MSESREVSSVGNMDSAFFVSRKELIEWVNHFLKLNITKIEQCSNGAIYIQLLDILFPNKSVLHKVKWNAKLEYECIINYKLIQSVFNKLGIKKYMDVDKLIKGKYQDNLEFLQWFKAFFERIVDYNNEQIINYDAIERRKICILGERGDYKLLNNYLPDWAKVDISIIKEKISNSDNRTENHAQKKNPDSRGSIGQENGTTRRRGGDIAIRNVSGTHSVSGNNRSSIGRNRSSNNCSGYSSNVNYGQSSKRTAKGEKRVILVNTANDHNHSSIPYRDGLPHRKQTPINAANPHSSVHSSAHKRPSISNKLSGRSSASSCYNRGSVLENQKDIISLSEQNKKLKGQLENKNNEITLLQNKLQEEEYEKKVLLFQKNFYYNKLRFLELLCNQTDDNFLLISDIHQIIYARENTYFHQTIPLKDKTNNDQNEEETMEGNYNTNDIVSQSSIPNGEAIRHTDQYGYQHAGQYNGQSSIDSSAC
ncbi:EB1 homolog, putative [Plasmodium ovale]|uniref:EB1 homolog, putative n=2 Tax=Plasmodium ovale TaxID=36330 RepID=A0A1A8VWA5_PLAOA|nr:EB1 homolog, putative [Plasmodium ovale curtisi]SCP04313.1 EB1 homolog, putative [Plasmodium ovale]